MPPEQNSQGRRPHYHRGRRGSDRRGPERRHVPQAAQEQGGRDHVDVEQIMREIRARISQRHGIELTTAQIQELAARRLEAILDPRTLKPSLLEQLRKSAATPLDTASPQATPAYVFEDRTIYESHNGLLRFIRRLLNPILKLFFNPGPIAHALNAQAKLNSELAARHGDRDRQQAEWNALHYDILQRLVTETARVSIEMQSLSARVESLGARVDFNDRRVRGIEAQAQPARPPARPVEPRPAAVAQVASAPLDETVPPAEPRAAEAPTGEGGRRRRRRRRGRRSGAGALEGGATTEASAPGSEADLAEGPDLDIDDTTEDDLTGAGEAEAEGLLPSPERTEVASTGPGEQAPRPTAAATPPPFPHESESPAAAPPPSPPRDEPAEAPTEPPDQGPVDR